MQKMVQHLANYHLLNIYFIKLLNMICPTGADPGLGKGGHSKGIPANLTVILTTVAVLYRRTGICNICTGIFSWDKITDCV